MILDDGKEIKGIFLYSDTARFSKSDFIIEDDCMYICKLNTPSSGLRPSENPTYFVAYPGDKVLSLEEYEDYIKAPEGKEDKYISSSVLVAILQQMYYGFGDTGIIEAYIKSTEEDSVETNISQITDKLSSDSNVLDLLIREADINNAYIQVDRKLPELSGILINDNTAPNCILRQYTYQDSGDSGETDSDGVYIKYRYRIQELIDFKYDQTFYRYIKGTCKGGSSIWEYGQVISGWIPTTINSSLLNKITEIINYYNNDLIAQEAENTDHKFNFKELVFNPESHVYLGNSSTMGSEIITTVIDDFTTRDFFITLNIKRTYLDSISRAYSLTINTKDCTLDSSRIEYYYLEDNLLLRVELDTTVGQEIKLRLVTSREGGEDADSKILSIYYRNNKV